MSPVTRCFLPFMFASLTAGVAQGALVLNGASTITHNLRVQPIIVQQAVEQGGAVATYFGNSSQQGSIEGYVDAIWAQAGIDVTFLTPTSYVSSFAFDGHPNDYTATDRPTVDLTTIVNNGPVNPDPTVLNMFFVEIVPGFSYTGDYVANGLAYLDFNGATMYVSPLLLGFTEGLEAIASVVSHEIGHNLGLDHIVEAENLMQSGGSPNQGERISAAQIATIFTNTAGSPDGFDLLIPVPEPATATLGLFAAGLIVLRRRR